MDDTGTGSGLDEILNPVQGNGEYAASLPLFGGLNVWKAKNKILDTIAVTGVKPHVERVFGLLVHFRFKIRKFGRCQTSPKTRSTCGLTPVQPT